MNRKGDEHKQNCKDWVSTKVPWNCNAHHILPVTCFNPIEVKPKDKMAYVRRCIWVSQWDINGGNRFKFAKGQNNMVRLPLYSAYFKSYPASAMAQFKRSAYPVNECMHNSRYSEHYLYIKEVRKYLNDEIWSTLQEDKKKHKNKGKDILSQLRAAEAYFRGELERRGNRTTAKGNSGTKECWFNKKTDPQWTLPFSMAADPSPAASEFCTRFPI
jgi:hypothetical protein